MKKRLFKMALMVTALMCVMTIGVGAVSLGNSISDGMLVEKDSEAFTFNMSALFTTDAVATNYYYKTAEGADWTDGGSTYTYTFSNYGDQSLWFKCVQYAGTADESSAELAITLRYYQGGATPTVNADGFYEIYSYQQLEAVSAESSAVKIKLMDDIDVYAYTLESGTTSAGFTLFANDVLSVLFAILVIKTPFNVMLFYF